MGKARVTGREGQPGQSQRGSTIWQQSRGARSTRQRWKPQTLATYRTGHSISGVEILRALELRNLVTRSAAAFFSHYDLLLTPTLPVLPPLIGTYALDATGMDGHQWTSHVLSRSLFTPVFNAAGFPAMSLPLFTDDASDLPIGMQFVTLSGREDLLFRVAGQLKRALPWAGRRPRCGLDQ